MKTILVISNSSLLRNFLEKQLSEYGFKVILAPDGLNGSQKIRHSLPDLIIMDYFLTRKSSMDILKIMNSNTKTEGIPVIMTAADMDKRELMEMARLGVGKILSKPVKIDILLATIAEKLGLPIDMDVTPCILDVHLNDRILFVEVSRGFNREKINLLYYKSMELIQLYEVTNPHVLMLISNTIFREEDESKLETILKNALQIAGHGRHIHILTVEETVKDYISNHSDFQDIEISATVEEAIDNLLDREDRAKREAVRGKIISSEQKPRMEAVHMNFSKDFLIGKIGHLPHEIRVVVVDDDRVVCEIVKHSLAKTGWKIKPYMDARLFIKELNRKIRCDLLFLDLLMPNVSGFEVLQRLKTRNPGIPVIIMTALSQKESVLKALEFEIKSYLIKPINPRDILAKAVEVLGTDTWL